MRTTLIETADWVTGKAINTALAVSRVYAELRFEHDRRTIRIINVFGADGHATKTMDDEAIRITVTR